MGNHYYSATTGELIEGGLREARKCSGLPSPTTVLQLIKGPGLIKYLQRQAWEGGVTTPRLPGEADDDYFDRCMHAADEHSKAAREKGGDFHTLCQKFHLSTMGEGDGLFEVPKVFGPQFDGYLKWYETYVENTVACEQFVLGQGYAGRLDHLALLKDGRLAVCDVKTQSLAKRKSATFYPSFFVQLGAYAGALPSPADVLVSIVVSADISPVIVEAKYSERPVSYYHQLFLGLLEVWKHETNYWPEPAIALPA